MPTSWQRLTIVIHSLTGGGSEHAAAVMATHWAEAGHPVVLLTLDSVENDQIDVSPRVKRVGLSLMSQSQTTWSAIRANQTRIRRLREALIESAPDRVISLTDRTNILTLLAARRTGLPVIVSERTDLRHHRIGRIWEWLRKRTYPTASSIVVQTEGMKAVAERLAGNSPVHVIPNSIPPVVSRAAASIAALSMNNNWFAAVGRLSYEKGFDRLIEAFARTAEALPDWNLLIIGDGPERERLQDAVEHNHMADRILMPGWIEQPWSAIPSSAIVVLPSRYEGFPNVLLEAMSHGFPTVAFDCQSGPSEIIRHHTDGLLVSDGDVPALASAMQSLATNAELAERLGAAAKGVNDRFSPTRVFAQWEAVLNRC